MYNEDARRMNDERDRAMRDRVDERDYRDDRRRNRDYDDYADDRDYYDDERRGYRGRGRRRDYEDYESKPKYLTKSERHQWKSQMRNVDGTRGEHFDMQQVMTAANKLGVSFKEFTENEFCLAMNMMYSDFCKTVRKYVPEEKQMIFYAELALDYFEDPDSIDGSEKLAKQYRQMVEHD